jgi:multidrug resistance efflux pump
MLELLFCSMLTILPDFLYRRFGQGKRIGREITLYSVWFELRWGITMCVFLTVGLITVVFYNHPSTKDAISLFRTIPITTEGIGRVAEVYVGLNDRVEAGQPLFRLDDTEQRAASETARRRVAEIDAQMRVAESDLARATAQIAEAQSAYRQALDQLEVRTEIRSRNPDAVALREIEQLQNVVDGRLAGVAAAEASRASIETELTTLLPAQKASAEAALAQADADLAKTVVYAGVNGTVQQFTLRPGDILNPMIRVAGVLVPEEAGRIGIQAGFGQVEAQVMKPGMTAEVACASTPFRVIPMVVTEVQGYIAAGQIRPTDVLVDTSTVAGRGTLTVYMEPMFAGGIDDVVPGSTCVANAYTSNYERLHTEDLSTLHRVALHVVDTVGLVHALILRMQALIMPIQSLVFSGGH